MAVCTPQLFQSEDYNFERSTFVGRANRQSLDSQRPTMGTPPKGRPPINVAAFPSMAAGRSSSPEPKAALNIATFSSYSSMGDARGQKKSLLGGNHQPNAFNPTLPRCPSPNTTLGRQAPSPQSSYPVSPESDDASSPVSAAQKPANVARSVSGTGNAFLGGGNSFLGRAAAPGAAARLAGESNNGSATPPRTFANEFGSKVTNKLHQLEGDGSGESSARNSGELGSTAVEPPSAPINAVCLNMQEVEDLVTEKEFSKAVLEFIDITTISSSTDDDGTETEYVIWGLKFSDAAGWEFPAKAALPETTPEVTDSPARDSGNSPVAGRAFPPGASGYFGFPRVVPTVIPASVAKLAERGATTLAPNEEPMKRLNGPREVDLDLLPKYMTDDDLTKYIFD